MSEQYHFEFKDWQEAFAMFYRKRCGEQLIGDDGAPPGFRKGNPRICLVISTAPYVSGYWIEEDATKDEHTTVYRTLTAVRELERRIKDERAKTVNVSLGGVIR